MFIKGLLRWEQNKKTRKLNLTEKQKQKQKRQKKISLQNFLSDVWKVKFFKNFEFIGKKILNFTFYRICKELVK